MTTHKSAFPAAAATANYTVTYQTEKNGKHTHSFFLHSKKLDSFYDIRKDG
jgi:hypothetical protein